MEKHIEVRMEKCTGCRLCELACSVIKTGQFNPRESRIKVRLVDIPEIPVPMILDHCDYCSGNPVCVRFCLPKAIDMERDGGKASEAKSLGGEENRPRMAGLREQIRERLQKWPG